MAAVAMVAMLTACGSDKKTVSSTATPGGSGVTTAPAGTDVSGTNAPGVTLPPGLTIPPGATFPADVTVPQAVVDQVISQLEQAGVKVDRACFENLLKDPQIRNLVLSNNAPSSEVIQRLVACLQQ
jgi:hypothetical protein